MEKEKVLTVFEDKARKNYNELLELKKAIGSGMLLTGKLLMDNRDKMYWKVLGFSSFNAFIGSDELSYHRSTAFKMIGVFEKFVKHFGIKYKKIEDIDMDKLYYIIPVCTKANVHKWIEKARIMSRSTLREAIQGKKEVEKIAGGNDWLESTDVWIKRQPISRWGKYPKDSIYGQFVANLLNLYTKPSDKVYNFNVSDTVIEDVCKELKRDYAESVDGTDVEDVTRKNNDLGFIRIADIDNALVQKVDENIFKGLTKAVKKGGKAVICFSEKDVNENNYNELLENIKIMSGGSIVPEKMIIVVDEPEAKTKNRAIRDKKVAPSFDRIIVFNKK